MIAFVVGTTAELIKIAPVHHELTARGNRPLIWFSAQHVEGVRKTLDDLDLPAPDVWLVPEGRGRSLARPKDVPSWATSWLRTALGQRKALAAALRVDGRPPLVVVHGDTFTCPMGALMGRLLGASVAHLEAGLRSGSLTSPFPEELDRRLAARLADIHFAPTSLEAGNLRRARGVVVVTGANTVVDAVRFALNRTTTATDELPAQYGVVTLHRFELIQREDRYRAVLQLLKEHSRKLPLVYFAGAPERERLARWGLASMFDGQFQLHPKLSYLDFIPVLAEAELVVTDSGGLQEECAYLGIPCAIHRERTERQVGLGENVVLTATAAGALEQFLEQYPTRRRQSTLDAFYPSRAVVDFLAKREFLG